MEREKIPPAEQQRRYNELEQETSTDLAYFYCCIAFDVPFAPEAVPKDEGGDRWVQYLKNLARMPQYLDRKGKYLSFLAGRTNVLEIFGASLDVGRFREALEDGKPGTREQRETWGVGPKKYPYTAEDYDELDRTYKILSSDLEKAGGVSVKQEFVLRRCSTRTLEMKRLEDAGRLDSAKKLQEMIQKDLESEQLRKKDAKPVEDFRLDSLADALEKAGLMREGKWCPPDEAFEIFFGRPPAYPYTRDAADQMILINENRMRNNDGLPELGILPDEMRLVDELGEFAQEQSPREVTAYEKLGLVKMPPVGQGESPEEGGN